WTATVQVSEAKVAHVAVPALAAASTEARAAAVPSDTNNGAATAEQQPWQPTDFPAPIVEEPGRAQRTAGYIVGTVGLAALGLSASFGIDSLVKHDRAKNHCSGDLCDAEGVHLRDRAMTSGNVSTITAIAGGAAFVGGIVLLLTAPRAARKETPPQAAFWAEPQIATNGGGLSIHGVLP